MFGSLPRCRVSSLLTFSRKFDRVNLTKKNERESHLTIDGNRHNEHIECNDSRNLKLSISKYSSFVNERCVWRLFQHPNTNSTYKCNRSIVNRVQLYRAPIYSATGTRVGRHPRNRSTYVNRCEITPCILARCPTTGSAPRSSVSIIVVPARISSQYVVHEVGRAQLEDLFCQVASSTAGTGREEHGERRRGRREREEREIERKRERETKTGGDHAKDSSRRRIGTLTTYPRIGRR